MTTPDVNAVCKLPVILYFRPINGRIPQWEDDGSIKNLDTASVADWGHLDLKDQP